jgi:anthranilate phosphoribosyltransferase
MNKSLPPQQRMREYIQLVATGPELSKSLDSAQAKDAMALILSGELDQVRAGIFLIALRMKRETEAENAGVLDAILDVMQQASCDASDILAMADPFNGFLRSVPATPFVPAVLAACGLPSYIQGIETTGPKYGLTPRMILQCAGCAVDLDVGSAARRLDDPETGWSYIDQRHYAPSLHDLMPLRESMVKRTCLSTIEVVLRPLMGAQRTHLLTGFVHKAYPPVYAALADHAGFHSSALVRGVEGGCIPSLSQLSRYFASRDGGEPVLHRLAPRDLGIGWKERAIDMPEEFAGILGSTRYGAPDQLQPVAEYARDLGLEALSGGEGPMRDSIVYAAAIGLAHTGKAPGLVQAAGMAREAIDSGAALKRFQA